MDTTRRDLLRSTLLAAALPRPEPQGALSPPPGPAARPAAASQGCLTTSFVDHRGWIIPVADRDALQVRDGAGGPPLPPAAGEV